MILKKVNNVFVLEGIPEDTLNIKLLQCVEGCINILFIDSLGYIYVKDLLNMFKLLDKDFSFEMDDSISDDDCISSFVKFIFYRENCINGRQIYDIIFQMKAKKNKKIRDSVYDDSLSDLIDEATIYTNDGQSYKMTFRAESKKNVKDMILKKVNNVFVLDSIPKDALSINMFNTVENWMNNIFIYNAGCFYVKDLLKMFKLFDEDFSFKLDDSISDDDRICSFVKFIFCKGDCTDGEQRYKIIFQTETEGD